MLCQYEIYGLNTFCRLVALRVPPSFSPVSPIDTTSEYCVIMRSSRWGEQYGKKGNDDLWEKGKMRIRKKNLLAQAG